MCSPKGVGHQTAAYCKPFDKKVQIQGESRVFYVLFALTWVVVNWVLFAIENHMLQELAMTSQAFVASITQYGGDVLLCVLVAWCVHGFNVACQYRLNILGIYPRHVFGLIGIVTSPWLHGNWAHLISNTLMFILMSLFMLMQGMVVYVLISVLIILMTGILVWLLARRALHIGASGLIMGYFGFLVVAAIAHPGIANIAVSVV